MPDRKVKSVVTTYNPTGNCFVSVDEVVKQWSHLWHLTQYGGQFKLTKMLRKDSDIKVVKVQISTEQATQIIKKLGLVEEPSSVFKRASSWVLEKHEWFYFKKDTFRCCRKCGCIENKKITDGDCRGKVKVEFR